MFSLIKKSLEKTLGVFRDNSSGGKDSISKTELEELLVMADVNYDLVENILESLPSNVNKLALTNSLSSIFYGLEVKKSAEIYSSKPFVDLIVGINGAGKTTTIAKLANMAKRDGKSVLLGAGDTFRAAAVEQLKIWSERLDVKIVMSKIGADPASVAYDAINSAKANNIDYCIIDTAGRLHTQSNLAEELKKIVRICQKADQNAPHRKLAILDGTAGQSGIAQAKAFDEIIGLDGIVVTKLDGTAKGGMIFSVAYALKLPILYIGVGEKPDDFQIFESKEFIDEFVGGIFG